MKKAFCNSLPKSGTNLVAKCLQLLDYSEVGGFSTSSVLGATMKARIKRFLWTPVKQGYIVGIDSPVEISRRPLDKMLVNVRPGSFIFGHFGYTADLLSKLRSLDFAMFVMLRDPRAVLNSFVHYLVSNKRHPLHEPFIKMTNEDRYLFALSGYFSSQVSLQPMKIRCRSIEPWIGAKDVCNLHFEHLVGPKGGGTEANQYKILQQICNHLELPNDHIDDVASNIFGPGRATFRKGKIDAWKTEIPENIIPIINNELDDVLKDWGYSI